MKLDELQTTLSELQTVQKTKQAALASLDANALHASAKVEGSLADRLRAALSFDVSFDPRLPATRVSLRTAIEQLPHEHRPELIERLNQLIPLAQSLQQQVASYWLSIWRVNEHVNGMIDILARAGQPAEVDVHHGLMFDATA